MPPKSFLIFAAVLILACGGCLGFCAVAINLPPQKKTPEQHRREADRQEAIAEEEEAVRMFERVCEDVRARLRSPATAKFPDVDGLFPDYSARRLAIRYEDDSWIVVGWVDSQNGFGAEIRSMWTASVSPQGEIYDLTIDDSGQFNQVLAELEKKARL